MIFQMLSQGAKWEQKDHRWGIQSSVLSSTEEVSVSSVLHRGRGGVIIVQLKKKKFFMLFKDNILEAH